MNNTVSEKELLRKAKFDHRSFQRALLRNDEGTNYHSYA